MQPSLSPVSETLRSGTVVGRYRIERALARSNMSNTYKVVHELTGAPALLKLTRDKDEHLRHEASVLAQLDSPFIPGVLDLGTTSTGQSYLLLEYCHGVTLADLVHHQRRLDAPRVVAIGLSVLQALRVVHAALLVHGDIKPSNILVCGNELGDERAVLIDFGSALRLGSGSPALSRTLTPAYLAPEGLTRPSAKTDLFALALVLYEALSGRKAQPAEGSWGPALNRVVPASEALSRVLERALAVDPGDRFASADELERALLDIPEGELTRYRGMEGVAARFEKDTVDTVDVAEASRPAPLETKASRPFCGDVTALLSTQKPLIWVLAGDPGTDQPTVAAAIAELSERYDVEWLDESARERRYVEYVSGAPPPWVILCGDLHVMLGEPLIAEARRQAETSVLLVSTHANWELLHNSINAVGLHGQVCLPSSREALTGTIEGMVQRARELRRRYDTLRLALRDTQEDLQGLRRGLSL